MKKYLGGCHCGLVRYEVETELTDALSCNCSHCSKKGLVLVFVDKEKFKLLSGRENLTEYFFNKKAIRHLFCDVCGTESFAEGVTFPKVAINVRCLDGIDMKTVQTKDFNGKDY
ncbi:MAG: GFA family protein [Candidatus Moranbacteria bacterium]|nr:GFA family protein [Candidatus Moranbacteria bacterium]